ncbi:MAG: hypothetical protein HY721_28915 [Planctomycetes bacterium]|nr:hypothetical protein [Planctomycetota bacterium]
MVFAVLFLAPGLAFGEGTKEKDKDKKSKEDKGKEGKEGKKDEKGKGAKGKEKGKEKEKAKGKAKGEGEKEKEKGEGQKEGEPAGGGEGPDAGAGGAEGSGGAEGKTSKPKGPASPDEELVKEKLKDVLSPTDMKFLEDGRVHLVFDLTRKSEEHSTIFTPKVGSNLKETFRWSMDDKSFSFFSEYPGVRLSNRGVALLNCWFTDDLEAEVEYLQHIAHSDKLYAAVIYSNDQGKALASNFGSQCAMLVQGRLAGGQGKVDSVSADATAKFKLSVKDGSFEAYRDGRSRQKMKYPAKGFASGRIGFAWGGSIASTLARLEIKGKLDYARMAKEMRKAKH